MRLDLSHLRRSREHVARAYPAAAFDATGDEFLVVADIRLDFDVEKQGERFRLTGSVSAGLELACSRCLEPMPWPVETSFDLRYLPMTENEGEGEREVADEDLGVAFYEGDAIDLAQLLREQFYLTIPMKPLCRPDCAGLCPECGANLNVAPCGCEHRWVDPRMAGLAQLLPKEPTEH